MCLSLIQENVGLYSSYFIEKEEEDIELDIIIPQKRIPNWSERMDALLNDAGDHLSMGENGVNVQEVNIPGMVEIDSDSKSNTSSSTLSAASRMLDWQPARGGDGPGLIPGSWTCRPGHLSDHWSASCQ